MLEHTQTAHQNGWQPTQISKLITFFCRYRIFQLVVLSRECQVVKTQGL
jgi:hypothetical protein